MSDQTVYTQTRDKPNHWHSRRHQSSAPHDEARARYDDEHSKRARQLRALDNLRERLTRYISIALNNGSKVKRRSKKGTTDYVPKDLQHATDLTREEIKILEFKLGIKTKIEVTDDEGEDED